MDTSDEDLLALYAQGDARAARLLVSRLGPRVYGYCFRMLRDSAEAEDVTQEALVRLWKIAPDWQQGAAKVSTWVFQVAGNLCRDRLRRSGRSQELDDQMTDDSAPAQTEVLMQKDRAQALDAALAALPDRQREAVILRHIEGLSNPEIAGIMDIGVEAVESLTARGKRALKAILAGRKEELGFHNG